jgi:hypothetical protein
MLKATKTLTSCMQRFAYTLFLLVLMGLAGCGSTRKAGVSDVLDVEGLSSKAKECINKCATDTTGPDAIDRSKVCACACHKKFKTGRHETFCSDDGTVRDQNLRTIHDNWERGF